MVALVFQPGVRSAFLLDVSVVCFYQTNMILTGIRCLSLRYKICVSVRIVCVLPGIASVFLPDVTSG